MVLASMITHPTVGFDRVKLMQKGMANISNDGLWKVVGNKASREIEMKMPLHKPAMATNRRWFLSVSDINVKKWGLSSRQTGQVLPTAIHFMMHIE